MCSAARPVAASLGNIAKERAMLLMKSGQLVRRSTQGWQCIFGRTHCALLKRHL